jgi:ABC-type polysaccharide/polyol phosphate transport system ATPase subunit
MALLTLENAGVTFRLRARGGMTLKDWFVRRAHIDQHNPLLEVRALSGLNLRLEDGDRLGIVGHNGAGKSTLLRLLAGVYPPVEGRRTVTGSIAGLFDLALGFEMEASGRENISLRGFLQGETPDSLGASSAAWANSSTCRCVSIRRA